MIITILAISYFALDKHCTTVLHVVVTRPHEVGVHFMLQD